MNIIIKSLKWITNIASVAILALVFFIIGAHIVEGFNDFPETLTTKEIIASIALVSLILGTLMGLKWELIGGVLAILGYLIFMIGEGGFVGGIEFNLFLIIAILNVILYWFERK